MTVAVAISEATETYFRALAAVDVRGATRVLLELLDRGVPLPALVSEVVAPAQALVGELWESGTWTVADEHAATAVSESALAVAVARGAPLGSGRHVLLACAEGEWHAFPARLAAAALTTDARVTVLGPSVPADHLRRRLSQGDVDLLALSCTLTTNLVGAARCIEAAREAGVPVVVGGRAFGSSPRRAAAVGAGSWSPRAQDMLAAAPVGGDRSLPATTEQLREAARLDAVGEAHVALAYERLVAAHPDVQGLSPFQHGSAREELRMCVRSAAAAVLTDDQDVLRDALDWTRRRSPWDAEAVFRSALYLLADVVEHEAPEGAARIRRAADAA